MRNLIRSPLAWAVAAELIVVASILALAWHVVASGPPRVAVAPSAAVPDPTAPDPGLPDIGTAPASGHEGPLPGLNVSGAFWKTRLAELNRDQALFAQLEWRLVHTATDVLKRYVETVVLPAVRHAERAGRASALS